MMRRLLLLLLFACLLLPTAALAQKGDVRIVEEWDIPQDEEECDNTVWKGLHVVGFESGRRFRCKPNPAPPPAYIWEEIFASALSAAGGDDTEVQFNDGGTVIDGADGLTYSPSTKRVKIERYPWCDVTHAAYSGGADPTGVADASAAINAAATACGTTGTVLIPEGSYKINSTVTFTGHLAVDGTATLTYDTCDAGPAVRVGAESPPGGLALSNRDIELPIVTKTAPDWFGQCSVTTATECVDDGDCPGGETCVITDCGTVGVDVVNLARSRIVFGGSVNRFTTAIVLRGYGHTASSNVVSFTATFDNKIHVEMRGENSGGAWNQNTLLMGRMSYSLVDPEVMAGTRHVLLRPVNGGSGPNVNTLIGPDVEGDPPEFNFDFFGAAQNIVMNARFEGSATRRVRFVGSTSNGNQFLGGYDLTEVDWIDSKRCSSTFQACDVDGDCPGVETCGASSSGNSVQGRLIGNVLGGGTSSRSTVSLQNPNGDGSPYLQFFLATQGSILDQIGTDDWTFQGTAGQFDFKKYDDTSYRLQFKFTGSGSQILFDDGVDDTLPTATINGQLGDMNFDVLDNTRDYVFELASADLARFELAQTLFKAPIFTVGDGTSQEYRFRFDTPDTGDANPTLWWDPAATPNARLKFTKDLSVEDDTFFINPPSSNAIMIWARGGSQEVEARNTQAATISFDSDLEGTNNKPFTILDRGDITLRGAYTNTENEIISQNASGNEDMRLVLGDDEFQALGGTGVSGANLATFNVSQQTVRAGADANWTLLVDRASANATMVWDDTTDDRWEFSHPVAATDFHDPGIADGCASWASGVLGTSGTPCAASGDVTDVGDCDGPACFTAAGDGTTLTFGSPAEATISRGTGGLVLAGLGGTGVALDVTVDDVGDTGLRIAGASTSQTGYLAEFREALASPVHAGVDHEGRFANAPGADEPLEFRSYTDAPSGFEAERDSFRFVRKYATTPNDGPWLAVYDEPVAGGGLTDVFCIDQVESSDPLYGDASRLFLGSCDGTREVIPDAERVAVVPSGQCGAWNTSGQGNDLFWIESNFSTWAGAAPSNWTVALLDAVQNCAPASGYYESVQARSMRTTSGWVWTVGEARVRP